MGHADRNSANRSANNVEKASPEGTIESLLKTCSHGGDIDGVERILSAMRERGEQPNRDHYNAMVHACAQAGDVVQAQTYLRRMSEIGLTPNIVTYNRVINACAAQGAVAEAEMWLLHMKKRGLEPTEVTYGTICKALARAGNVERIDEIMAGLEQDGLTLNEYFYASLISACGACQPPNLLRAEKVPFEMHARGLRAKSVKRTLDRVLGSKRAQQVLSEVEPGSSMEQGPSRDAAPSKLLAAQADRSTTASSVSSDYGSEPPATPYRGHGGIVCMPQRGPIEHIHVPGMPVVAANMPIFPQGAASPPAAAASAPGFLCWMVPAVTAVPTSMVYNYSPGMNMQ